MVDEDITCKYIYITPESLANMYTILGGAVPSTYIYIYVLSRCFISSPDS